MHLLCLRALEAAEQEVGEVGRVKGRGVIERLCVCVRVCSGGLLYGGVGGTKMSCTVH